MLKDMVRNSKAAMPMRRHALAGMYSPRTQTERTDATGQGPGLLCTTLPVSAECGDGFDTVATGGTCCLPDGGAVAVAGRPTFSEAALEALAHSQGPAAALAKAYTEHDKDLFSRIGGAFSFCIIDTQSQRALAAVDRFGQYSFYYRLEDDTFAFGSEAGMALDSAGAEGKLEEQGLYNYLYFHMVPGPGTVYAALDKLPAAHYVEFSNGLCRRVNYWLPRFRESTSGVTFVDMGRQLKEALSAAVDRSRVNGGRIGAFLSGGLDSTTVTGLMSELGEQGAEAYSIGFAAEGYDEMAFARITAKHFGVRLNEYYVTPEDVVDALPLVACQYDEPFGNSSALPAYFCAKMAAEHGVDTLLAGDGGDEIFGGNERYQRQEVFAHYARIPGFLRRGLVEPLTRLLPASLPLVGKARSYIEQANTPLPDRLQSYNFLHRHAAEDIFTAEFLSATNTGLPLELLRAIYQLPDHAGDLHRMLYLDWQITLADNDLRKVSQMCAFAGVDVVYPMLDDALVEFACSVPAQWKIRQGDLRHFYKESLRGWLPSATIDKSKKGFGLPFGVWMRTYNPLRELAYDNLLKLKQRGFIQPQFLDRAIEMHQSEHAAYYGELVWILTVLELWLTGRTTTPETATST